jgi:hypothetical protein
MGQNVKVHLVRSVFVRKRRLHPFCSRSGRLSLLSYGSHGSTTKIREFMHDDQCMQVPRGKLFWSSKGGLFIFKKKFSKAYMLNFFRI